MKLNHLRLYENTDWKLIDKIEKIISNNCKEIEWEGTEVDRSRLKEDILTLIKENKNKEIIDKLEEWIRSIEQQEDWVNMQIFAKEEMQKYLEELKNEE